LSSLFATDQLAGIGGRKPAANGSVDSHCHARRLALLTPRGQVYFASSLAIFNSIGVFLVFLPINFIGAVK